VHDWIPGGIPGTPGNGRDVFLCPRAPEVDVEVIPSLSESEEFAEMPHYLPR